MSKKSLLANPINLASIIALVAIVSASTAWLKTGSIAFVVIIFATLITFKLYIILFLLRFDQEKKRKR